MRWNEPGVTPASATPFTFTSVPVAHAGMRRASVLRPDAARTVSVTLPPKG